ncbi:general odorant-binding protein 83a-like [Copidosoma floridanum]|uniref:general odorant-binding protein 83a-like n=1 Tax=Copidosoma floridanum TaxID=29053 RepID=UPI000C6F50C6|nr:general odorant-binding protein 83a-like [Copidosoma floridanum]
MNYFAPIVLLSIVYFAGAYPEVSSGPQKNTKQEMQYKNSCITESKINKTLVERVEKGEMEAEMFEDEKLNCYYSCFFKKTGVMKPNGTIDEKVLFSSIPPNVPKEIIDKATKCIPQVSVETNHCEIVGNFLGYLMKIESFLDKFLN